MIDTTELQQHTDAIDAQQALVDEVQAALDRASAAASAGTSYASEIAALRQRREVIVGEAFIAQKPANTKAVDAEIKSLEQKGAEALAAAQAAASALPLLRPRLDAEVQKLRQLWRDQVVAAVAITQRAIDVEEAAYEKAGQALLLQARKVHALRFAKSQLAWRADGRGQRAGFPAEIMQLNAKTTPFRSFQAYPEWTDRGFFEVDTEAFPDLSTQAFLTQVSESMESVGVDLLGASVAAPPPPPPPTPPSPPQRIREGEVTITQNGVTHSATDFHRPTSHVPGRVFIAQPAFDMAAPAAQRTPDPAQKPAAPLHPSEVIPTAKVYVEGVLQDPSVIRAGS